MMIVTLSPPPPLLFLKERRNRILALLSVKLVGEVEALYLM